MGDSGERGVKVNTLRLNGLEMACCHCLKIMTQWRISPASLLQAAVFHFPSPKPNTLDWVFVSEHLSKHSFLYIIQANWFFLHAIPFMAPVKAICGWFGSFWDIPPPLRTFPYIVQKCLLPFYSTWNSIKNPLLRKIGISKRHYNPIY